MSSAPSGSTSPGWSPCGRTGHARIPARIGPVMSWGNVVPDEQHLTGRALRGGDHQVVEQGIVLTY